ncbi:MAG: type II toxin-antitoxin system VapC family toxin [Bacteroidales bacterium]
MILLDSSVLIDLFRKKNKDKTLFYKLSKSYKDFAISSITYYEIGIGNRDSHFDYWNNLADQLTVIPFDKLCSISAIEIYLDLLKNNKIIDIADILIGATALTHNIPIATLNNKHFERIKNLELIK